MIEQALYGGQGEGGYRFLARSPGFLDEWLPLAERLCTGFGERPAGVACPGCLFVADLGPRHVAVVQAADQGRDDAGRPGALAFRLLAVPRHLYADLGGDPFLVAEPFPPDWQARGELPALAWQGGPPPPRQAADLQKILDVPESATLLGGAQVLVDGGRLVFERPGPAPELVRSLWALLPSSTRADLRPATFAFGNAHGFDLVVSPRADGPDFEGYVNEQQAGDYPEGRYEFALQQAIEAGDQREIDVLFARRSQSQTLRLALGLLAVFILVPTAVALFAPVPAPAPPAPARPARPLPPNLTSADECPRLTAPQRQALAHDLHRLAGGLGVTLPAGDGETDLVRDLAELDRRLGTPDPGRDPGPLASLGPLQRQIQALLWKQGVPGYDARGVGPAEQIEKLRRRLQERGVLKERPGD